MFWQRTRRLRERIAELEEALADEKAKKCVRIHLSKEEMQEMAEMALDRYREQEGL